MLTDYHVHLRPDEDGTGAEEYFTPANLKVTTPHDLQVAALLLSERC